MFKSKRYFIFGVLISLLLGLTSCYPVDDKNDTQSIHGTLKKFDSISGDVTLILNDGSTLKSNLKDVNVETISRTLGNTSLEPGTDVTINEDKSGKIKDLKAHSAEVEGVIRSVELLKRKVTITLEKKGQITLNVTPTTSIVFMGSIEATLDDLIIGQRIEASYDVENKNALKLNTQPEDDWAQGEVRGNIVSMNSQAQTITVLSETGVKTPPLKVTASSKLWVDKATTFRSLYVGMGVKIRFNPETNELLKLEGKDLRSPIERLLENSD